MSAPSIPNLLSLRGSRGGGGRGSRNRGRGGSGGGLHPPPTPSSTGAAAAAAAAGRDAVIQGTDTDAAVSRMSAVDLGYLDDPFAQYFVQRPTVGQATRRLPIINRGTYARTAALDRLISAFLGGGGGSGGEKRQIVSLGAGTDTRVFRLFGPQAQRTQSNLIYHEIDFPAVAAKKLQLVRAVPPLRNIVPDPAAVPITTTTPEGNNDENGTGTSTCWSSSSGELTNGCEYWCHGRDLRDLATQPDAKSPPPPPLPGLRTDVPTLLVSECCLCYLEAAQSRGVIDYFAEHANIANLAVVLYEPIRPDDAFGRQMVANLAARRIRMPSLEAYGTAAAQRARLRAAGFSGGAEARTVEDVWKDWVSEEEKERVDGLEGLDEVEEWNLLAAHYVVAWGWRGRGFEGWEGGGGGAG